MMYTPIVECGVRVRGRGRDRRYDRGQQRQVNRWEFAVCCLTRMEGMDPIMFAFLA